MSGKNKERLIGTALAVFSLLLSLALAEIALRWYGIVPDTDRLYAYDFDDMLGWKSKESFKYFRSSRHYAHFNYYNSQGYPSSKDDWLDEYDAEQPTIFLLGDSFAEGYYLPYEYTFAGRLTREFQDKYQFVNLGVSGYAPDQYLIRARQENPKFNVRKVVVAFFPFNDITDISRDSYQGYAKPLFGEDDLTEPVNTPLIQLRGKQPEENTAAQKIAHHSAIYAVLRPVIRNRFALNISRSEPDCLYERDAMEKALELIKQIEVETQAEEFIVYYIPRLAEIQKGSIEENTRNFADICRQLALDCLSFYDQASRYADPASFYIPEEGHFSKTGSLLAARQLYEILKD